ncbi:MAG TPA: DedA family protein, partial [Nakamurella sp.]
MVSIVSWLIEQVLGFPPWLALVLIFLLPAAEASVFAGFIFPGEVVVFFGGVLANEGRLALWTVILVGSLGAIIGDSIGYEVGRHYGMRLLARLPARLVKPDHVTRAQDLIRRKGGRAIFLGRFTAALRVLVPGLAGTSGMPYRRFLLFNVTGGITWVVETTLVGYVAGKSYRAAERRLSLISLGLLAAVV